VTLLEGGPTFGLLDVITKVALNNHPFVHVLFLEKLRCNMSKKERRRKRKELFDRLPT
jgi:hypothetical protein